MRNAILFTGTPARRSSGSGGIITSDFCHHIPFRIVFFIRIIRETYAGMAKESGAISISGSWESPSYSEKERRIIVNSGLII